MVPTCSPPRARDGASDPNARSWRASPHEPGLPGGGVPVGTNFSIDINNRGTVAFGGVVQGAPLGTFAVATDQGVVAQIGDMLPDGRTIQSFDTVAINNRNDVVFGGMTLSAPPLVSKELKRRWSYFIRKVYVTDPLLCPK